MISIIIPTHNSDLLRLGRTLEGLRTQTLPKNEWEIVIIDNASDQKIDPIWLSATTPQNCRMVREDRLGLTHARLRGFSETTGEIVVLVDDDNVLAPDYLAVVKNIAGTYPQLGAWSGNVILEFEPGAKLPPAEWRHTLTERHVTKDSITTDRDHHDSTPWGAGLCIRREVCDAYAAELVHDPLRQQLDLQGKTLLYGGDTDIAYVGCARGFCKGVFASLTLQHIIPAQRCEMNYLMRSIEGHAYSSVLHQFVLNRIPPNYYFSNPLRQFYYWVRRLSMPYAVRMEMAARTRGYARGERTARRLAKNL